MRMQYPVSCAILDTWRYRQHVLRLSYAFFFSDDSETPLTLMLDAGVKNGLIQMAVTDHFDPGYPYLHDPFELNFPLYHEELKKSRNSTGIG